METVTITNLDGTGAATSIEKATYDYDATGIRVSALYEVDTDADGTVDEITKTEYLNDPSNLTGYSQVIQETEYDENGVISKRVIYTLGHDQISQTTIEYVSGVAQTSETLFFGYDGTGSTRVLFDIAGAIATVAGVEQLFFFDAYGNLLNMEASQAATSYLYRGEQFDARIGQQYLRARYYDPASGRFNRLDPFQGRIYDPQSLHKYLYAHGDPINGIDPTGMFTIAGLLNTISVRGQQFARQYNSASKAGTKVYKVLVSTIVILNYSLAFQDSKLVYANALATPYNLKLLKQFNNIKPHKIQAFVFNRDFPYGSA
ncbi:tRNA(Glu)-specific nuclease WapA precursor [Gimesia panareensis]|uniref:tRNA(Glu)-specific nuclease WapA n=1 Tax=Gimesia panareensis TaxID=2527978 RepID=A0A517QCP6_9PLAN|nr:RHS repeat-associated core domain-containing protein [Gimesia panareensis]QDT29398.1 tRNA(Glu)-specific nuclease WapA precursor [Gimesia panareensis]